MELILLESVAGLGRPGDQVKVKPGYARNFLLPRGKGVPVSADVLRNLSKLKKKAEEEERALLGSMQELQGRLNGFVLVLNARATEEGHLFGSVTEKDVQDGLAAAGWKLPVRSVHLTAHVKDAGRHPAEVHLYGTIVASIAIEVVPIDAEGNRIEVIAPTPSAEPEPVLAEEAEPAVEEPAKDEKPARKGKKGAEAKAEEPARDEPKAKGKKGAAGK